MLMYYLRQLKLSELGIKESNKSYERILRGAGHDDKNRIVLLMGKVVLPSWYVVVEMQMTSSALGKVRFDGFECGCLKIRSI